MGLLQPHGRSRRPVRHDALSADAAFVVHSPTDAVAVLAAAAEARRRVVLLSAPEAGIYAGPGWWRALADAARAAVPGAEFDAVLDCGGDAGAAQGAIRAGVPVIVFTGPPQVAARLADIAAQQEARVLTERPAAALDLASDFFAEPETLRRRCTEFLAIQGERG